MQGFGRWTFGAEIMFLAGDRELDPPLFIETRDVFGNVTLSRAEISDVYQFIEYNIAILYNF